MKSRTIMIPLIRGVIVASALFVLTLGGPAAAPLEAQGSQGCVDAAWQDLNNCYMSGRGWCHDACCRGAFYLDISHCAAEAKRGLDAA